MGVDHDGWVDSWSGPEVSRLNTKATAPIFVNSGVFMSEQAFHELHAAVFEGSTGIKGICGVESDEIQDTGCEEEKRCSESV